MTRPLPPEIRHGFLRLADDSAYRAELANALRERVIVSRPTERYIDWTPKESTEAFEEHKADFQMAIAELLVQLYESNANAPQAMYDDGHLLSTVTRLMKDEAKIHSLRAELQSRFWEFNSMLDEPTPAARRDLFLGAAELLVRHYYALKDL